MIFLHFYAASSHVSSNDSVGTLFSSAFSLCFLPTVCATKFPTHTKQVLYHRIVVLHINELKPWKHNSLIVCLLMYSQYSADMFRNFAWPPHQREGLTYSMMQSPS